MLIFWGTPLNDLSEPYSPDLYSNTTEGDGWIGFGGSLSFFELFLVFEIFDLDFCLNSNWFFELNFYLFN